MRFAGLGKRAAVARKAAGERPAFERELRHEFAVRSVLELFVLACVAVPPVFVNHPIGYLPLVGYLLLLALSWGYVQAVKRGFSVEHGFESGSCARGGSVGMPVVLKNRSRLPILRARPQVYVTNPYGEVEHEAASVALVDAMDDEVLDVNVQLGHVGVYSAGLKGIVLYDPLRLFHAYARVGGTARITAVPQEHEVGSMELSNRAVSTSPVPVRTVLSDDVDYAGTRDYEYGDPLKSIHWKLSARTDDLQTRLFESSVNTRVCVVLDFHGHEMPAEQLMACTDVVVEAGLAVARLALARNMDARLCYVDKHGAGVLREVPGEGEAEAFTESLPLLGAGVERCAALELARRQAEGHGGSDHVVLCSSVLSRELAELVLGLAAQRKSVSVMLAVPRERIDAFYGENRALASELEAAGAACIVLSDPAELEVRDGVE